MNIDGITVGLLLSINTAYTNSKLVVQLIVVVLKMV